MKLDVVLPTGAFWYNVEHPVFLFHLFYLHVIFSKVKIKRNSEVEVKNTVVWLVFYDGLNPLCSI
jgi:hypothetical protein